MADGVFKAELNNFLTRELAEDGYSGVEVRVTPTRTEIIILATRTQNVLGEKGRRIRELTSVVQKRFNFPEGTVEVTFSHSNSFISWRHLLIIFANSLDPDQARQNDRLKLWCYSWNNFYEIIDLEISRRQNVGPALDPNCLRLMVILK